VLFVRYLVIGGAGFIGSNLVQKLVRSVSEVTVLDNYFSGSADNHVTGVSYIEGGAADIQELLSGQYFDTVFHFGEYSRVEQSFEDIDLVFELNYHSIYSVLKFARYNAGKLVYAGSSTKFGDDGSNGYASPYAFTKKCNSELVNAYCTWFDLDYAVVYFYNAFGENEISSGKYTTVVAKFISLYKAGERSFPVVSPGTQRRNFTHVEDVVEGLLLVSESGKGDGYGIGSDDSYSLIELVKMFNCEVQFIPARKGNRLSAPVNSDKTKGLGWTATRGLIEYVYKKIYAE
jgi:UDP-glucose 4-epimerase